MKRLLFPVLGGGVLGMVLAGGLALRAGDPAPAARTDQTKHIIEAPATQYVTMRAAETPAATGTGFVNPKVQPGKVHWHPDF